MMNDDQNNGKDEGVAEVKPKGKFAVIIDRLKQKPATAVAILLACFTVLAAIVAVTVIFTIKKPAPQVVSAGGDNITLPTIPAPEQKMVPYDELSKQIKLSLFEHNISRDSITESAAVTNEGKNSYTIKVNVTNGDMIRLNSDLAAVLALNRMPRVYSDDENVLICETNEYRLSIILEKPKSTGTKPVSTPVATGKDPFGVTMPKGGNAKIALLIDDCGMNLNLADRLTKMKVPVAMAILPYLAHSRETADLARARGKTVFLHFPMEPLSYPADDPGEGAVLREMPEALIQAVTKKNVENLGSVDGFNNHMGSALTEDAPKMRQVFASIRPYTTFYVDSNTSSKSVALETCREVGFTCGINRKFLDNSNDHAYIASKMYEAIELASKNGPIIVIGHLRPDTILVLESLVPELQKLGYQFVPIKSVMQ